MDPGGEYLKILYKGPCMGYFLREADVLSVRPCLAQDLRIGDIVAVRQENRISIDRYLANRPESESIVTKPDNRLDCFRTYPHHSLIGAVCAVQRGSRKFDFTQRYWRNVFKWFALLSLFEGLIWQGGKRLLPRRLQLLCVETPQLKRLTSLVGIPRRMLLHWTISKKMRP